MAVTVSCPLAGRTSSVFCVVVAADQRLWQQDMRQHRVDEIANKLPRRAWKRLSAGSGTKERDSTIGPWCAGQSMRVGSILCWCGAVWTQSPSTLSISLMPQTEKHLKDPGGCCWPALAVEIASRWQKASVAWTTTKSGTGKAGIGISLWPCWPCSVDGASCREKKNLSQEGSSQRSRNPASARPVAVARLAKIWNISCSGLIGEGDTNFSHSSSTTENEAPCPLQLSYNCSTRLPGRCLSENRPMTRFCVRRSERGCSGMRNLRSDQTRFAGE